MNNTSTDIVEHLCDLNDLRNREDFKQIKDFYGIKEGN
jgi:hypothetical protein